MMWLSRPARLVTALVLGGAVLTGCGSSDGSLTPGERALATAAADYSKDYTHTTCREFLTTLTDGQRTAAAARALIRLRADDGLPAPLDSEVDSFEAGMQGACEAGMRTVVRAAVFVYLDK